MFLNLLSITTRQYDVLTWQYGMQPCSERWIVYVLKVFFKLRHFCMDANLLVFNGFLLISLMLTDQLFVERKRLDWLPKASANVQRIMAPHMLQLQNWQAFKSLSCMQPSMTSISSLLTLKQPSWMLLSLMRYTVSKYQVFLKLTHFCAIAYFRLCMASNSLCTSGIQSFVRLLKTWVSLAVKVIMPYFLVTLTNHWILQLQCPLMDQNFLLLFAYMSMTAWMWQILPNCITGL